MWRLLKLLKWNGFGHQNAELKAGELAFFCPACPQPGVNCSPSAKDLTEYCTCLFGYESLVLMKGSR